MSGHVRPRRVGGDMLDPTMLALLALAAAAGAVIAYRFTAGIGAVSNMNDGYTWGIWEPVNVVVFTGIGAGAYAVGLLCYVLNRGEYHPLVRPAVLLGAIAYALGGASVIVALGRYWNVYWLGLPPMWNLNSVLLEVAVCVIAYLAVLWVEVLPAVLESAAQATSGARAASARRWSARLSRAMPFIIALAMVLPTMHQSSLGGLMLVAGPKLHPLWHTPLLPLLALVSCLSMGCGAVVVLAGAMARRWRARYDRWLLAELSRVNAVLLGAFAVLRVADLASHGKLRLLTVPDRHLAFFALETALFTLPALLFFTRRVQSDARWLTGTALATVLAGALWRVDTFITCYAPGARWRYVPSLGEIAVTVGMAAIGAAVFIAVARRCPIVTLEEAPRSAVLPSPVGVLTGGTSVPAGYYVRRRPFAFVAVGRSGDTLPGRAGPRWHRAPVLALACASPLVATAFLVAAVGFSVYALARRILPSARVGARELAATLVTTWVPGEAHLAGRPLKGGEAGAPPPDAADPTDTLSTEIEERRRAATHR